MSPGRRTTSDLAYDRHGPSGRLPVVLVHAGIADRRMWDPLWERLTIERDVIRLDLRGFGESDVRPSGRLDHVGDVVALLDELDVPRCDLVGASFGAGVAVETALTRPDRVRSLLLAPPGGSLLAELTPALRTFIAAENEALARGDLDAAVDANVETWVVGAGRDEAAVAPDVLAAVRVMQRRAFDIADAWGDVGAVELDPPALERLPQLTAPVLVLVGGHDLDTTHDAAARVAAGAVEARRVDWDDVAHLPSMERPAEFVRLVLEWTSAMDQRHRAMSPDAPRSHD
jgi:3-oxoadipate enol-lactonase